MRGRKKNILWLTHSKLLDFSWVGQRGRVHDSKVSFVFWDHLDNQSTTKKKIPSEYMGSWAVCKMLSAMVPERPTPVKVHSSNFVYGEHIKRNQSDWKTQNNSKWNSNLTTNFQVHAPKKKIPFPSFTPCVPKGIFFFPSAQPLKLILTLSQSLQVIKVVKYS